MIAFSFTADVNQVEVVRLADGRLAERAYNARSGKMGWIIYSNAMAREYWLSDRQMEAMK